MKKLLLTTATLLFIITAQAQSNRANIIGFSTGYYNAVIDPTPNFWWRAPTDRILNFSRGNITSINLQKDMPLSKRLYFSPSLIWSLRTLSTDWEAINGNWRRRTRDNELYGGGVIRFKYYILSGDSYRYYTSFEAGYSISLFENTTSFVNDLNGERTQILNGNIFQRRMGFFPSESSYLGINFGYEKQINKNQFWYLQAGYASMYNGILGSWDNLNRHYYNIGVGIGFQKFKFR